MNPRVSSLAVALVVMAAACAPQQSPLGGGPGGGPAAAGPKRIQAAIMSNPPTISSNDVIAGSGTYPGGDALQELMAAGLTHTDGFASRHPQLAEAVPSVDNGLWRLLPDGRMETTWKIKQDALWHDGTPVTAGDVAFTATLAQDRDLTIFSGRQYRFVEAVETPDERTVLVKWKETFIRADQMFDVLRPRHVLEKAYREEKLSVLQHPYWTDAYVGGGPFRLREFVRDSHLLMEAYDRYVLGRPKIDEIFVRFISDPNTLAANILAGTVELTMGRNISLAQAVQLRERWTDGGIDVGSENWIALWPQMLNPDPPIVLDVRFRRAILHGIDRQAMVDTIQHGMTSIPHTILHPSEPMYKDIEGSIVRYDFDPRRAGQLLEELGYVRGADGLFRDATGQTISLEVRTSGGDDAHEAGVATIADNLKRVGVNAFPFLIPQAQRSDREYNATYPGVRLWRQNNGALDLDRLHSREAPLADNRFSGGNRSRYMNAEFDALLDRYVVTVREADRAPLLAQVVRHMAEHLNVMGLWYNTEPIAVGKRLRNISAGKVTGGSMTWNAYLWDAE